MCVFCVCLCWRIEIIHKHMYILYAPTYNLNRIMKWKIVNPCPVCLSHSLTQYICIGTIGNEMTKIRLYCTQSDFNAIFHPFGLCMQTIHRHFQLKMNASHTAFWIFFYRIRHSCRMLFSFEKKNVK